MSEVRTEIYLRSQVKYGLHIPDFYDTHFRLVNFCGHLLLQISKLNENV